MPFISVTRLRLRSIRFVPQFVWYALTSSRQAQRAPGFLDGNLMGDGKLTFWTVTAWTDEAAMRDYRNTGAHRRVMPKLLNWCDEASIVHWNQDELALPNVAEAHRRMTIEGRMSKVKHPSAAQTAKQIAAPQPGKLSRPLKPKHKLTTE